MTECRNHKNCLKDLESKVENACIERNLKFTDLRREVFLIVSKSHGMVKAYDILAQMRKNNPLTEPPTIYRALNFLIENNFIHKINSLNSYITCYHLIDKTPCFFLICLECGSVEEVVDNKFSNLVLNSVKKHKFSPQRSNLEIEGICSSCNK